MEKAPSKASGQSKTKFATIAPAQSRRRNALRKVKRRINTIRSGNELTEFEVPYSKTPLVSIVIPVHGKWDYTYRCLRSIVRHHQGEAIEVLVVNDASPDDTLNKLKKIKGVRVVDLQQNVGFTKAANRGWQEARGENLVLLNNDTTVKKGWLKELLRAGAEENVGLVGAKLLYPDDRLQEAGGIVFNDGSGWNYGRLDDPQKPEYCYRREVDYISGAAILLTPRLLAQVSGFDEQYAPAYYEDTDLAFATRAAGLKVIFEPFARVVHHEGISHGTDISSGTKRFQEINKVKFVAKWEKTLECQRTRDFATPTAIAVPARRPRFGTVVIFDHRTPTWTVDSGSLRMLRIIKILLELNFDVVLIPLDRKPSQPFTRELQQMGVLVWNSDANYLDYLRQIESTISVAIMSRMKVALVHLHEFQTLFPSVPVLFDTVDLHFLREQRAAELDSGIEKAATTSKAFELAIIESVDGTLVVSEIERDLLAATTPKAKVFTVSNVHDSGELPSIGGREEIVFVGNFAHAPNVDGIHWFLTEVFPLIQAEIPQAKIIVVGKNPPSTVTSLASDNVDIAGFVKDLGPVHQRTRVSIAPLRFGAGVKGKVGDAWTHGLPVVMTSIAAEGMGAENDVNSFVVDEPNEFADAVIRLIRDDETWTRISREGQSHVGQLFGSDHIRSQLQEAFEEVGVIPKASEH